MTSTPTESDRIPLLLIHGAWLSARSWDNFADYFSKPLDGVLEASAPPAPPAPA